MKACPDCGQRFEDRFLFCSEDGATLIEIPSESFEHGSGSNETSARAPVVFCPACSQEYPLSFTLCPAHGLPLTSERKAPKVSAFYGVKQPAAAVQVKDEPAQCFYEDASDERESAEVDTAPGGDQENIIHRLKTDRPSFRFAALATMSGLAIFILAVIYTVLIYATRKPASPPTAAVKTAESRSEPSAFIQTPQEAREYKEEAEKSEAAPADTLAEGDPPARPQTARGRLDEHARMQPAREPVAAGDPPQKRNVGHTDAGLASEPVIPRSTQGRVDARLVRVRSQRISPGVRYDLTFTIEEQSGQTLRLERLLVSTQSANGSYRSQTLPFYHRLGASGALTFTVSVDMPGRSESDWRGRIVCTSIGTDQAGKITRASFGANVTP
jgi:hypothetical protein